MNKNELRMKAENYLNYLVSVKPNRRTGSLGNRQAVEYFRDHIQQWGFQVDTTPFGCLDHEVQSVSLKSQSEEFKVNVSPYSLGCDLEAKLVVVTTLDELKTVQCEDGILLLKDEIAEEQLQPKNFVFYNPDDHKEIYRQLESKKPAGIITSSKKNPSNVGAKYPYPMIQDGDFDIPSVYCSTDTGEKIATHAGETVQLTINAKRTETTSFNVIASKNRSTEQKIVVCAHIDAYGFSPGALDNASGTAVLLLLGELLENYDGSLGVEIIAFNGEDHYSAAGEMDYLSRYSSELEKILVMVNIDSPGYIKGNTHFSFYGLPIEIQGLTSEILEKKMRLGIGDQWYQGDHMVFVQKKVPAIAITSENVTELMADVTHSEKDTVELVDLEMLVSLASVLKQLIETLS